ncbi:hypothetical protein ANTQUA_LOCUS7029 [Anthophora quadrimaculata]
MQDHPLTGSLITPAITRRKILELLSRCSDEEAASRTRTSRRNALTLAIERSRLLLPLYRPSDPNACRFSPWCIIRKVEIAMASGIMNSREPRGTERRG